ncbi:MAG: 50S ribosomal protein L10 [Actinobacteria bacterium]|nr:MAG: 50S ribosomal protein L10 [Actinomycetota bacterium]
MRRGRGGSSRSWRSSRNRFPHSKTHCPRQLAAGRQKPSRGGPPRTIASSFGPARARTDVGGDRVQKSDKERVVAELTERLRTTETLIVADYRGLTVTEIDGLRSELLKHGARFSVVKNTLTRRAAEAAGADTLLALLEGPSAIAFLEADGDPVAVAKALSDVARTTRVLAVRGGVLDGSPITAADIESLAKLPPADVLRGQLVSALAGPLTTVVGLFAAPMRDFVGVLQARIDQLQAQGGGAVEEEQTEDEPEPQQEEEDTESAPAEEETEPVEEGES